MLLCSPCVSGTPAQSPSSTHHTETLPADTDALATNSPENIQERNTPAAPSEALGIPVPPLSDNSLVEAH